VGAPWLDPRRLAAALNNEKLPGVKFIAVQFTPNAGTHRGIQCGGVSLILANMEEFEPVLTGMTMVSLIYRLYPHQFNIEKVLHLLGNEKAVGQLKAGRAPAAVLDDAQAQVHEFLVKRERALLYGAASKPKEGIR
jgi:uncharacterized protein YbbC (DUF1343 family)